MNIKKNMNLVLSLLAITGVSTSSIKTSFANNGELFIENDNSKSSNNKYNVNWIKRVGDAKEDKFYKVIPTKDKGYIAVGQASLVETTGFTTGDALIVKYNSKGEEVWRDVLQGDETDRYYSIVELNDGSFVAFGVSYSTDLDFENANRKGHAIAVHYSDSGSRGVTFGYTDGSKTLVYKDAVALSDGTVLAVCGEIKANIGGGAIDKESIVLEGLHKIDFSQPANMKEETVVASHFNKKNVSEIIVSDIIATSDNNILMTGHEYGSNADIATYFVMKMDKSGKEVWFTSEQNSVVITGNSLFESKEGDIYVAGKTNDIKSQDNTNAILMKLEGQKGQIQWSSCINGDNYDSFNSVSVNSDGDIIVTGHSNSELENTTISKDKTEVILAKFDKEQGTMSDIVNLGEDTQGIVAYSSFQDENGDLIIAGKQGFTTGDVACDLINPCTQFDAVLLSVDENLDTLPEKPENTDDCVVTTVTLTKEEVTLNMGEKIDIFEYLNLGNNISVNDVEIITNLSKDENGHFFTEKPGTYDVVIKVKDECGNIQTLKLRVIFKDPSCPVNPPAINGKDEHIFYVGDNIGGTQLITVVGIDNSKLTKFDTKTEGDITIVTAEYESGDTVFITSNLNPEKEGVYYIKYLITNQCGEASKEVKITVKAKESGNNNNNNNNGTTNKPQTGDNTLIYVGLALMSVVGLITINAYKQKETNEDDNNIDSVE